MSSGQRNILGDDGACTQNVEIGEILERFARESSSHLGHSEDEIKLVLTRCLSELPGLPDLLTFWEKSLAKGGRFQEKAENVVWATAVASISLIAQQGGSTADRELLN